MTLTKILLQFIKIYFGNRINGTSNVCCRKWDREGGMDWIDLAHDRECGAGVVNAVMNCRVP